jgi:alpha-D-ribose 1-methylphosphonate 5-triphosphate synthase subunit PhnL
MSFEYDILNIDDPTASLKNYLKDYVDVDLIISNSDARQEGKELKRIFSDLIKENDEVKRIMNNSLQGEQWVYDLYKSSEKTIKNNSTV